MSTNICGNASCAKRSNFNFAGKPAAFCATHAEEGMINVSRRWCAHAGCPNHPCYAKPGGTRGELCLQHAEDGMVRVCIRRGKACASSGCPMLALYGVLGSSKREFCSKHAKDGMVKLQFRHLCAFPECAELAWYRMAGCSKPAFCSKHATDDMKQGRKNVACAQPGCIKVAYFGFRDREYCANHAKEGMNHLPVPKKGESNKRCSLPKKGESNKRCSHIGCTKVPRYGVAGSRKAELCGAHAIEGMVNVVIQTCTQEGCYKEPSFGRVGSTRSERCAVHAIEGMINVRKKRVECAEPGCTKSAFYGQVGVSTQFCADHAKEGTYHLARKRRCSHEGCPKVPMYGVAGSQKAELCGAHASEGMVNVVVKTCKAPGCFKVPCFGRVGSKQREVCAGHASEGMINVAKRGATTCAEPGCTKSAFYGVRVGDLKNPTTRYCAAHAKEGMYHLARKRRCSHEGCPKVPMYGVAGSQKAELCGAHASEGMVNVVVKTCKAPGCFKVPCFGRVGSKQREVCAGHASEGMINVVKRSATTCAEPGCTTSAFYGVRVGDLKNPTTRYCAAHAKVGMYHLARKRKCSHEGCPKVPRYGVAGSQKAELCGAHASEGMVNVVAKTCKAPGCFKEPCFGRVGSKQREVCAGHASEGMINVAKRGATACAGPGCTKSISFGIGVGDLKHPAGKFSADQAKEGMHNLEKKRCSHVGCPNAPRYGVAGSQKAELCGAHASEGMVNVVSRACKRRGCNTRPQFGRKGSMEREFCKHHAKKGMVNLTKSRRKKSMRGKKRTLDEAGGSDPSPQAVSKRVEIKQEFTCNSSSLAASSVRGQSRVKADPAEDTSSAATLVEPFMGFTKRRCRLGNDVAGQGSIIQDSSLGYSQV